MKKLVIETTSGQQLKGKLLALATKETKEQCSEYYMNSRDVIYIYAAFGWEKTSQGVDFWRKVNSGVYDCYDVVNNQYIGFRNSEMPKGIVVQRGRNKQFRAQPTVDGRRVSLGWFHTRQAAARKINDFFATRKLQETEVIEPVVIKNTVKPVSAWKRFFNALFR